MTQLLLTLAEIYIIFLLGYAIRTFLKVRKLEKTVEGNGENT